MTTSPASASSWYCWLTQVAPMATANDWQRISQVRGGGLVPAQKADSVAGVPDRAESGG